MKLVLLRHGESEWNKLNLFTGWTDIDLSEKGREEALNTVLDELDRAWLPVIKSWKLNERHYGALQGLNKAETAAKYGEEQVKIWRRSFDVKPPALEPDDDRNPAGQMMYRDVDPAILPVHESLETTIERVIPYFEETIKRDMAAGNRVIIAAHGNSLRALVKYFDGLSNEEIIGINIPTGVPLVYEFDDKFNTLNHYYLGNQDEINAKMQAVANQGSRR